LVRTPTTSAFFHSGVADPNLRLEPTGLSFAAHRERFRAPTHVHEEPSAATEQTHLPEPLKGKRYYRPKKQE
jgi:hypothetical protein